MESAFNGFLLRCTSLLPPSMVVYLKTAWLQYKKLTQLVTEWVGLLIERFTACNNLQLLRSLLSSINLKISQVFKGRMVMFKVVHPFLQMYPKNLFYFHSTKPDLLTSITFFSSTQILWAAMPYHLRSKQRQTSSSPDTRINSFWFMSHSWLATEASKMTLGLPSGFPAVGEFLPYKSIWNYGKHPIPPQENPDTVTVPNILVQDSYP